MDPKSGQIFQVKDEPFDRASCLVPIGKEEIEAVQAMTLKERREWAKRKIEAERRVREELVKGNRKQRRKRRSIERKKARAKAKGKK